MFFTSLPNFLALVLAFLALNSVVFVDAALFVIKPLQGSTCHGGQKCTIEWLDDGQNPLLSAIGASTVGLFTGKQQLVQTIQSVDVSSTHSITFTPNPRAGPNSDTYYISIASTTLKVNGTSPYLGFSPFFNLDRMTGSFASPVASLTSTRPIPSTSATSSDTQLSTITVGTLQTSLPPISSLVATPTTSLSPTRFVTSASLSSTSPTVSGAGTGTNPSAPTPSVNAAHARTDVSIPFPILGLLSTSLFIFSFS